MSKTVTRRRALTVEMTSGSLWKNILLFSLPLMMTQVLEVLFNLSDVAIAGKYAYNTYIALGAVGSTTTLVSLFTGLLIGVGAGVNVAAARGLGMEDNDNVEKTVHSSFLICLGLGVLVCLVCVFFAEPMLRLLNTKEEFLPGAVLYLKLYAIGLPGMGLYNCGNGILSATGDTKRPLVYLFIAGVLNVVLNLVFVIGCNMSAEGVAIASAIAQWVSAILIVIHLLRRQDACRLDMRKLRLHPMAAKRVLMIGIPSGLQNAIFAVANLFVQVGLNGSRRQRRHAGVQHDGGVLHRLRQLRQPQLGRGTQGAHHQELSHQHVLRLRRGQHLRRAAAGVRTAVPEPVCRQAGGHRRRYGSAADHGVLLRHRRADGRQHCRLPRYRQEHRAHRHGHSRLLRVPGDMDLHGVRLFPHGAVPVPAVHLLLGHHRHRGVHLLPRSVQKEHPQGADMVIW